jgi:hypothetical protein
LFWCLDGPVPQIGCLHDESSSGVDPRGLTYETMDMVCCELGLLRRSSGSSVRGYERCATGIGQQTTGGDLFLSLIRHKSGCYFALMTNADRRHSRAKQPGQGRCETVSTAQAQHCNYPAMAKLARRIGSWSGQSHEVVVSSAGQILRSSAGAAAPPRRSTVLRRAAVLLSGLEWLRVASALGNGSQTMRKQPPRRARIA